MFKFVRNLIAEILPQQPTPRRFQRRSLLDKRNAARRSEAEQRPAVFGRRGEARTTDRQSRR